MARSPRRRPTGARAIQHRPITRYPPHFDRPQSPTRSPRRAGAIRTPPIETIPPTSIAAPAPATELERVAGADAHHAPNKLAPPPSAGTGLAPRLGPRGGGPGGRLVGRSLRVPSPSGWLRTHFVTSVGAAVFCIALLPSDPGRAVQGVASGVGFIGAAAVLRNAASVRGITAAASVWTAAALGCIAALGRPLTAVGIAASVAAADYCLRRVVGRFFPKRGQQDVTGVTPEARRASTFRGIPEAP